MAEIIMSGAMNYREITLNQVVTETNLIQRSFADMKHGERAIAIATHYNAKKATSENPKLCVTLPRQNAHLPNVNSANNTGFPKTP